MLRIKNARDWIFDNYRSPGRRRGHKQHSDWDESLIPRALLAEGVRIEPVGSFQRADVKAPPAPLEFTWRAPADEVPVILARHPSGAITFHGSQGLVGTPSRSRRSEEYVFRLKLAPQSAIQRGLITSAIRLMVAHVRKELIDRVTRVGLKAAAQSMESLWWRRSGMREGLFRLNNSGGGLQLEVASTPDAHGRTLLFLHGTFSSLQASFGQTLTPVLMKELSAMYPAGIFGFEHFSIGKSIDQNAAELRALLEGWPNQVDLVGYSRGGLLARLMADDASKSNVTTWQPGKVILCATPNQGTPLATSNRWEETLDFLTNLLELFPDNPFCSAVEFVGSSLIWLAARVVEAAPGLSPMNQHSEFLKRLNSNEKAVPRVSAIGANYQPEGRVWERLLDAGVDGFFSGANDLVVPTSGSWSLGPGGSSLPAARVACFGPGGNLRPSSGVVHHLNLMAQPETGVFVERALAGSAQQLEPMRLESRLPTKLPWRGSRGIEDAIQPISPKRDQPKEFEVNALTPSAMHRATLPLSMSDREGDRTLHLVILESESNRQTEGRPAEATVIAIYGGARVVHRLPLNSSRGDREAGERFRRIIEIHNRINDRLDGANVRMPTPTELRELGRCLFEAMFVGPVLRLYDAARAEQGNRPLNLVITSAIPWLAGKPWEFAFDPSRKKFLATEDVHLIRNVLTAVPAERPPREQRPLRILIVEAQPAGTAFLSIDEERERIRHRFQSLIDAGLAEVSVLVAARPDSLHDRILRNTLGNKPFDVVHFIGHGEFDEQAREGRLLFVEEEGFAPLPVGIQTLRELLCNRGIQLVFLNACDTARQPKAKDRGIAQALVEAGLPAVVANQFRVLDPSAVSFAERFYWALAQGATLGDAAREARIAVNYSTSREAIDWAVPVLYARDADYRLCQPPRDLKPLSRGLQPDLVHRRLISPRIKTARVGVADLSRYYPGLDTALERLNQSQDYFEFQQMEVRVPLEAWGRFPDAKSDQVRTYLLAEQLAAQLQSDVPRMGLDYLFCLTNWWLCESPKGDRNLFGWWSESSECPVLIGSTAGLKLPARSDLAGRVLANEFVVCCGGFLHDAFRKRGAGIVHDGPPLKSIFRYDSDRGEEGICDELNIGPRQEQRLLEIIPLDRHPQQVVAALKRLLMAF